ncbi:peroxiredoxin-like family protein [Dactylosporangium siamense]|uniref:Alkyl hydroperoxide reductase n=1 Tax=Dactylosporangium siamense TaxID=685454 RepID=A0A919PT88_9ACTN|nr:peroxiredoxin-like family protein [Dactylosporangium siamense]GIG49769.1 alkyl hydroperoxide reductase [Dactylosporangium siamense]
MVTQQMGRRLVAGQEIPATALTAVDGAAVDVPDPGRLVHLQFRRFAGCPVCNLHLRSITRRHDEIAAAGIREVVVFHSSEQELRPHVADLPFAVIADPGKRLYVRYGVEAGRRALLNPRVWVRIVQGIARDLPAILRRGKPAPALQQPNGRLGLPADFLIAGDGRLLAVRYGTHAYDQWSVDELLTLARAETGPR